MLTGVHSINDIKFYDLGDHGLSGLNQYDNIHDEIYGSDEFRMFAYKIKRCTRTRSHDWTECPFAHRGEKATRRDPQKVSYVAIACPKFRNGKCHRGENCEFAHGVFEYWLHPARYRTRACNAGRFCQRKVCFFAHTSDQLRSDKKYACPFVYKARMNGGDSLSPTRSGRYEGVVSTPLLGSPFRMDNRSCFDGVSDLLINRLKIRVDCSDEEKTRINNGVDDQSEDVLPHLDWISELVK